MTICQSVDLPIPGGHARVHWLHRSGIREIPRRLARGCARAPGFFFGGDFSNRFLCCKSCVQEISIDNSILIILSFLPWHVDDDWLLLEVIGGQYWSWQVPMVGKLTSQHGISMDVFGWIIKQLYVM